MHRRILRSAHWALLAAVLIQGAALAWCADDECHGQPFNCATYGCTETYSFGPFDCCCSRTIGGCCQYSCIYRECSCPGAPPISGTSVIANGWPSNIFPSPSTCADPPGTCVTTGGGGGGGN